MEAIQNFRGPFKRAPGRFKEASGSYSNLEDFEAISRGLRGFQGPRGICELSGTFQGIQCCVSVVFRDISEDIRRFTGMYLGVPDFILKGFLGALQGV